MLDKPQEPNGKAKRPTPAMNGEHSRTLPTAFQRPAMAGEADVLAVPWTVRFRWGWRTMVRETARQSGVRPEGKLRYVPVIALSLTAAIAIAGAIMAYGTWRGRTEARDEAIAQNQAATAALVNASEARLTAAANDLKQSAKDLKAELSGQIASIDGKVQSIQGSVGAQQSALAELRAELRAANEDKGRLWQMLETEGLKRERMQRQLDAELAKPD